MAYTEPTNIGTVDADLVFSAEQAIPTDGADDISTNRVDLIATAPRMGQGERAILKVQVTTTFTVASGTSSLLDIDLLTDASGTATIAAHSTVAKALLSLPYNAAAGDVYEAPIPGNVPVAKERYLALGLDPRNDDTLFSAGAISAWIAIE